MSEREIDVRFGARTSEFDAAMSEMAKAVSAAAAKIRSDLAEMASQTKVSETKIKASTTGIAGAFSQMRAGIASAISGVSGVISGLYRSVFSVHTAIVSLVGGGIVALVKGALESAAAIKDVGEASNASTRYIQEMRYAAAQNGASAEVMDDALIKLNKNLGEFRTTGAGPAAQALKQLGIDTAVMRGEFGRTDEAMDTVLRRLREVPSDADRAALAADLFGKAAGPKLAELMKLGEEGIQSAKEEARRLGLVLSDEMIAKADDADDKLNALWESLKMQGATAIAANADEIKKLAEQFAAAMPDIIEWLKECAKWWGILDRTPAEIAAKSLPAMKASLESLKARRDYDAAHGREWDEGPEGRGNAMIRDLEQRIAAANARIAAAGYAEFEAARNGPVGGFGRQNPPTPTPTTTPGLGGGGSGEDPAIALARSSAQQQIQIERDKELSKLTIWQQALDQRRSLGTISDQNYLMQAAVIVASETAIKRKAIEDQLAVENLKPQQRLALQGQLEQLELEHQERMNGIKLEAERLAEEARQREVLAERQKNEQIARDREQMANQTEGFINRLLNSQLNASSILMAVAQQVQDLIVRLIAEQVSMAIYGEEAKTVAAVAGSTARQGVAAGEGKGVLGAQIMKALKSIATAAAETFANVYAYFSPVMGPFAAIPAGVAAAAVGAARLLIPSARGGTEVTEDGLHMLHEKEVVLPSHWTRRLATMADHLNFKPRQPAYASIPDGSQGFAGTAGGGRGNMSFQINAVDAASFREMLRRYGSEMGEAMYRAAADGHFKPA